MIGILEGAMSVTSFNSGLMAREIGGRRILESTLLDIWKWRLRGTEADYDHARLVEPDEAFDIRSSLYGA